MFTFYSVFAFREKTPEGWRVEDLKDGPPLQARPGQQIAWLAVARLRCSPSSRLAGGWVGFYQETTKSAADALVVNVVGQEWTWTYSYPKLGVQSHLLELPLGRPVQFRVTSDDVLHGFGLAALGIAMDANPGEWVATPVVTPDKAGTFEVRCDRVLRPYHTFMWSQVKVVPPSSFAAWIKASGGNSSVLTSPGGGTQKAAPSGNEVEEMT